MISVGVSSSLAWESPCTVCLNPLSRPSYNVVPLIKRFQTTFAAYSTLPIKAFIKTYFFMNAFQMCFDLIIHIKTSWLRLQTIITLHHYKGSS